MKNFVIFDKETLGVLNRYEDESQWSFSGLLGSNSVVHMEIPAELDAATVLPVAFEDTRTIVITPAQEVPAVTHEEPVLDGEGNPVLNEFGEPTFTTVVDEEAYTIPEVTEEEAFTNYRFEVDATLLATKQAADKAALVAEAYAAMDKDVFDACEATYGTRRADSAMAFYLTFQAMVANPADYVGPMFADEAAVLAYATPKMALATQYSLYRLQRVAQFEAEKAAILG